MTTFSSPSLTLADEVAPAGAVLLIEDHDYIAHLLKIVFVRAGFSFLWARTGAEATRLAEENRDQLSLALVDLCLPDTTGEALSRKLRSSYPGLPLVMTSGNDWELDEHLEASGPTIFVSKPFLPSRLLEQARELLHAAVPA